MTDATSYREQHAPLAPSKRSGKHKRHGSYYAAGMYVRRYGDHGTICTATTVDWAKEIARALNMNLARAVRLSLGHTDQ